MESLHKNSRTLHLFDNPEPQEQEIVRNNDRVEDMSAAHDLPMRNAADGHRVDILRLEMLSLLGTKGLTGYELRKNIKASFNREISFGTLYPDLVSMEHAGLIRGQWVSFGETHVRKKRIFTLTESGKSFLSDNLAKLNNDRVSMQKMFDSDPSNAQKTV